MDTIAIWSSIQSRNLPSNYGQNLIRTTSVVWYLDDILITGETEEQHLANVEEVLSQLEKYGLRAHCSKCQFYQDLV